MRASYGTANSMARVLPLGVEIGEHALAVAMLEWPGSNIYVTPRPLSPTSPPRLTRARPLRLDHKLTNREVLIAKRRFKRNASLKSRGGVTGTNFLAKHASFARLCAVAQKALRRSWLHSAHDWTRGRER